MLKVFVCYSGDIHSPDAIWSVRGWQNNKIYKFYDKFEWMLNILLEKQGKDPHVKQ